MTGTFACRAISAMPGLIGRSSPVSLSSPSGNTPTAFPASQKVDGVLECRAVRLATFDWEERKNRMKIGRTFMSHSSDLDMK